ncbi:MULTISPECIES: AEC family transporter [Bifidobacterium]|uniref:AEC family transporter n=1 Tax=Bifidobacterium TaxID=1678 RepID=UPI001BDD8843|nr:MULTISPECIES: AEC family transporter [Bifidobacterium]MBT1162652.1 AEC family transporter [Bifidobacterium sp. SO1]MBW3077939.1 AEC family transporter [Bifidobacterium simiiventris]
MGQFEIVVGQLVGFFIMLMVGYICVRLRLYGQTALNGMCSLLLSVLIPLLVFSNAVDGTTRTQLIDNRGDIVLTIIMYALLIAVFFVVAHVLRLRGNRSHIFQCSMIFGNAGFIGIPILLSLFGKEAALFVALMSFVDQTILWTYGVWLCDPVKDGTHGGADNDGGEPATTDNVTATTAAATAAAVRSARPSFGRRVLALLRRFVNPAFVGNMTALILILIGIQIPQIVLAPLQRIGAMATPMSLIYLGGLFALTRWWTVLTRYELYVGMLVKMVAFPLGFYALLNAIAGFLPMPITHDMILMITLVSALPTMTTIAMFTGRTNNMPEYGVGFVLVTTLCSLLTLTFVSAIIL